MKHLLNLCFLLPFFAYSQPPIHLSAAHMYWNEKPADIILKGKVLAEQGEFSLRSQNEVVIHYDNQRKGHPDRIIGHGHTEITYLEPAPQTVICEGRTILDHLKKKIFLISPSQNPERNQQVCFMEPEGKIYANNCTLEYRQDEEKFFPQHVLAVGSIFLTRSSLETNAEGVSKERNQFAFADSLEYFPQTKQAILAANAGKKVIYFEESGQNVVKADRIILNRTKEGNQVESSGIVEYSMTPQELEYFTQQTKSPQ